MYFGPAGCSRTDLFLHFFCKLDLFTFFLNVISFLIIVPNLKVHNFFEM